MLPNILTAVRRRLRRIPALQTAYADFDILRKYGRLNPERVPMANSRHVIFVDPRERRGRAIVRGFASGQGVLKDVWRGAMKKLDPRLVLDVGANYGEFLFMPDYRADAIAIGVEANPALVPYLERSRDAHPDRSRIEVHRALAAKEPGPPVPFFVDVTWSGRSSALRSDNHGRTETVMIETVSIDSLLEHRADKQDTLLFKIDVEGYEPLVLEGMQRTFDKVGAVFGMLELNSKFLVALGVDAEAFVASLARRFSLRAFRDHRDPIDLTGKTLAEAFGPGELSTDLVVASDPSFFRTLGL